MTLAYLGRRNAFNGPWSAERTAQLVELWAQGFSAAQIVRRIGDPQLGIRRSPLFARSAV